MATNEPKQKFRCGNVTATIWENENEYNGNKVKSYSVSLERSYKDKSGEWKTTNSYGLNDLQKVTSAVRQAVDWMYANPLGKEE